MGHQHYSNITVGSTKEASPCRQRRSWVHALPSVQKKYEVYIGSGSPPISNLRTLSPSTRRDIFLSDISLIASSCNKSDEISWRLRSCSKKSTYGRQSFLHLQSRDERHVSSSTTKPLGSFVRQCQSCSQHHLQHRMEWHRVLKLASAGKVRVGE